MNWPDLYAVVESAFAWVWRTSLHASVLIGLVLVLQLTCGRFISARVQFALGLLVLLRLVLPVAPPSSFSLLNLKPSPSVSASPPVSVNATASFEAGVMVVSDVVSPVEVPPAASPLPGFRAKAAAALPGIWLAGLLLGAGMLVRAQVRLGRWTKSCAAVNEASLVALLRDCRPAMRVRRNVPLFTTEDLAAPAIVGVWKPRLMLPKAALNLSRRELQFVFLHELAHVKRHDVLLNWVALMVRLLHWFNPLVWWAARYLRTSRELVCDEAVLRQLNADERRQYGAVLIRLAEMISKGRPAPFAVPAVNSKQITRRIKMIAHYKTSGRLAAAAALLMVVVLGALTFTRAADKSSGAAPEPNGQPASSLEETASHPASETEAKTVEPRREAVAILERRLRAMEEDIQKMQADLERYRHGTRISPLRTQQDLALEFGSQLRPLLENRARLRQEQVQAEALYRELASVPRHELRDALSTAVADSLLITLLQERAQAEQRLAGSVHERGRQHPEVQQLAAVTDKINEQIDSRVQGVLRGLDMNRRVLKTRLDQLDAQISQIQAEERTAAPAHRRYSELQRELETQQRVRDALKIRIEQEIVEATLRDSSRR